MKHLYEIHIRFLSPEEGVVTIAATSEDDAKIILAATLDQVKELTVVSVKNLGPVPEQTDIDTSESVTPATKPTLN